MTLGNRLKIAFGIAFIFPGILIAPHIAGGIVAYFGFEVQSLPHVAAVIAALVGSPMLGAQILFSSSSK